MKEKVERVITKTKSIKTSHKYIIGFGLFAAITIVSFLLAVPDGYTPLYKDLSEKDKQDILVELSKLGVEYESDEATGDISVKKEEAAWVRKQMTQAGLPRQGGDYQSFIEGGLGDTQSQKEFKELNFKKGQLEDELVRIHPFIENATVRLTAAPATSIFDKEKANGSASVTLGLRSGHVLTRSQILGIQYMVASSMQGIEAEEVTVIDSVKGIISGDMEQDAYNSTAYEKQMEIKDKTEARIKNDINDTLSTIFGFENIKLNVMVDINFDKVERQIETYGDEGVLRSLNGQKEETRKTEGEGLEEAGADANGEVLGYEVDENGNIINYEQTIENSTENYEINRTVESIIKNPELTNTNISIWLDKEELEKREDFDMDTFRESIAISAGIKPNVDGEFENGFVSIFAENFFQEEVPEIQEDEVEGLEKIIQDYFLYIAVGAGVLLLLIALLIFLLVKKKKKKKEGIVETEVQSNPLRAEGAVGTSEGNFIQGNGTDGVSYASEDGMKFTDSELGLESAEDLKRRVIREERQKRLDEQIQELSMQHPKETADYVKKLLSKRG